MILEKYNKPVKNEGPINYGGDFLFFLLIYFSPGSVFLSLAALKRFMLVFVELILHGSIGGFLGNCIHSGEYVDILY